MTSERLEDALEERLRGMSVHDVSAERAGRTRDRCRAALASRAASRRGPTGRLVLAAGRWWEAVPWAEPLAALAASALYLVAAVAASLVLFRLGPPR